MEQPLTPSIPLPTQPTSGKKKVFVVIIGVVIILAVTTVIFVIRNMSGQVPSELQTLNTKILPYRSAQALDAAINQLELHPKNSNKYFKEEIAFLKTKRVMLDVSDGVLSSQESTYQCTGNEKSNLDLLTYSSDQKLLSKVFPQPETFEIDLLNQESVTQVKNRYSAYWDHRCPQTKSLGRGQIATPQDVQNLVATILQSESKDPAMPYKVWPTPLNSTSDIHSGDEGDLVRLQGEYWFIYLDPKPGQPFEHNVYYLFINTTGQDYFMLEENWFPWVNGSRFIVNQRQSMSSGISPVADSKEYFSKSLFSIPKANAQEPPATKQALIVIGGHDFTGFFTDGKLIYNALKQQGYDDAHIDYYAKASSLRGPGADGESNRATFKGAFARYASTLACGDELDVFISSHAAIKILTKWRNLETGKIIEAITPENETVGSLKGHEILSSRKIWRFLVKDSIAKDSEIERITEDEFTALLQSVTSCRKEVVFDACEAGYGAEKIVPRVAGVTMYAATTGEEKSLSGPTSDEASQTANDIPGIINTGPSYFIAAFITALQQYSGDNPNRFLNAFNESKNVVSAIGKQHPSLHQSTKTCSCALSPTPTPTSTPTGTILSPITGRSSARSYVCRSEGGVVVDAETFIGHPMKYHYYSLGSVVIDRDGYQYTDYGLEGAVSCTDMNGNTKEPGRARWEKHPSQWDPWRWSPQSKEDLDYQATWFDDEGLYPYKEIKCIFEEPPSQLFDISGSVCDESDRWGIPITEVSSPKDF